MKTKNKLIYCTKDYSLFEQDDTNRNVGKHPRLYASMQAHGWLAEHPAVVCPRGQHFRIKDGGHRISFAKELGLPIYYVVSECTDISIAEINNAVRGWSLEHYVDTFCNQGFKHYLRLRQFSQDNNLPIGICAGILGTSRSGEILKTGRFIVQSEDHANRVLKVADAALKYQKWARQTKFITAVSAVLRLSDADPQVLISKINSHPSLLMPQVEADGFVQVLESIYNYRNQKPVAITLQVKQGQRSAQLAQAKKAGEARKAS